MERLHQLVTRTMEETTDKMVKDDIMCSVRRWSKRKADNKNQCMPGLLLSQVRWPPIIGFLSLQVRG